MNEVTSQPNKSAKSMQQDMDSFFASAIRKLELQKVQIELADRFQRNMEIFKTAAPEIYKEFINYQPTELQLILDDDGAVNLANVRDNNARVYPSEPAEFSKLQVKDYLKQPAVTNIDFIQSREINDDYIYPSIYNKLLADYDEMNLLKTPNFDVPVGLFMMIGIGLGYQLIELLEHIDINNMCIVDPHKDSFFASLHTIEWTKVQEYFSKKRRFLKLYIGPEQANVQAVLGPLVDKIGLHNAIHTYVYKHFDSLEEKKFTEAYVKEFHLSANGIGFFDDERVSFAHTMNNLKNHVKFFKPKPLNKSLPPAFIVGNGPSLDELLPVLKEHKENAVIFSCGTTLGSLYKAGIKPDFHVEMERVAWVEDWILAGTDEEFRKDIVGLGLNTLHPDALAMFDRAGFAKKPNDLGTVALNQLLEKNDLFNLQYCNPTVTNAALSYALSMGFSQIYFLGVDLGTHEDGSHHSKNSVYEDIQKNDKDGKAYMPYSNKEESYYVEVNFGGQIKTNNVLDRTRINLEVLLKIFRPVAYNPNKGAKIVGAQAINKEHLEITKYDFNKSLLVDEIYESQFVGCDSKISEEDAVALLRPLFRHRKELKLKKTPDSIDAAVEDMNRVYSFVRNMESDDPIAMMLLRGTLNMLFTQIYKNIIFATNQESFRKAWQVGRTSYHSFLTGAFNQLKNAPLQLDNSRSEELKILKG